MWGIKKKENRQCEWRYPWKITHMMLGTWCVLPQVVMLHLSRHRRRNLLAPKESVRYVLEIQTNGGIASIWGKKDHSFYAGLSLRVSCRITRFSHSVVSYSGICHESLWASSPSLGLSRCMWDCHEARKDLSIHSCIPHVVESLPSVSHVSGWARCTGEPSSSSSNSGPLLVHAQDMPARTMEW